MEQGVNSPVNTWHQIVRSRSSQNLLDILAENVVFYSPIVYSPQSGKALTLQYLSAALQVLSNDSFRYLHECSDDGRAVLEFEVSIDDIEVNGVDMIRWNDAGLIVEFKVMLRPLKAIQLIQQKMAALLKEPR